MKRDSVIDLLRILAIIGVMGNHLLYPVYSRHDFFMGLGWWISLGVYTISLVAVPIFIIISGRLLINRQETLEKNFKRALHKILVPLLFWFSFYLIWKRYYRSVMFSGTEILDFFLSGNMSIYYFLVILLGLYLLLPIIQLVAKHGSEKLHWVILYGSFGVTWLMGLTYYFSNSGGGGLTLATWWLPYFAYFWWGFMSKKIKPKHSIHLNKLFFVWGACTLVLGFVGVLFKTKGISIAWKDGIFYWHSYLSPTVSLMSIGLFTLFTRSSWPKNLVKKAISDRIIKTLTPLTFGVYLVHIYVIDWVDIKHGYAIEFIGQNMIGYVLVRPLLVVVLSFTTVFFISKVPWVRRLVGVV